MVRPTGVDTWVMRPSYETYKSPYGPKYKIPFNFHGITIKRAVNFGVTAGAFGAVAGIAALFFLEGVPRVRKDILLKLPALGEYWDREIPPSDNPF